MYTWHLLTIGHLSRNKFWGEREDTAYRKALATSTLITGHGQCIVVDPSLPGDGMRQALLDAAGLRPEDVTLVFSTHYHLDHHVDPLCFPNAAWVMPQADLETMRGNWAAYIRAFPGDSEETAARCAPAPGEIAPGIFLVPLPGHTEGICGLRFDAPEGRVLVTGDAVMTREFYRAGEPYFFGWDGETGRRTIASLRGTADLIIPGHGEPFLARCWE